MKTTNKFLLIAISFFLAMSIFCYVQYTADLLVNRSIDALNRATAECECRE